MDAHEIKTYTARFAGPGHYTARGADMREGASVAANTMARGMGFTCATAVHVGLSSGEGWTQCTAELHKVRKHGTTIRPISFQLREAAQASYNDDCNRIEAWHDAMGTINQQAG